LVYQTEKLIKDNANLPEADKKIAEDGIASAKKVLENKEATANELEAETQKLQAATHKITAELYKNAGTPGAQPGADAGAQASGATSEKKGDDVIDADYKDVN
jgi:molecular chaperone DnaK